MIANVRNKAVIDHVSTGDAVEVPMTALLNRDLRVGAIRVSTPGARASIMGRSIQLSKRKCGIIRPERGCAVATTRIDFPRSTSGEPHADRARVILARHPEIRRQFGRNAWSALLIAALVALQTILAFLAHRQPWWVVLLLAYAVGAFVTHALLVLVHECAHNLVFERRGLNRLAGIVAGLPTVILNTVTWGRYHLKHHRHQGDYARDFDLPSRWEARLIGGSPAVKTLWLLLFPLFHMARALRNPGEIEEFKPDRWVVLAFAGQIAFVAALGVLLGATAIGYLLASLFFSIGLHPLGGRWVQEHLVTREPQETYSYYGPLNVPALNVGYHNEHHDFPAVPWNRLPAVKRLAPEVYERLAWHRSWTGLLLRFLVDRRLGLFDRMVRLPARPEGQATVF
jgi:sphingolipid delta-4 desaturase